MEKVFTTAMSGEQLVGAMSGKIFMSDGVLTIDIRDVPEDVKVVILSKRRVVCNSTSDKVGDVGKLISFSPMAERNNVSEVRPPISFIKSPRILIPTSPRSAPNKSIIDEDQEIVLPDEVLVPQT